MLIIKTIGLKKIEVVVDAAGTPKQVSSENLFVTEFELYVYSGNTGSNCYIGNSEVSSSWIPRTKAGIYNYSYSNGNLDADLGFNLKNFYVDADSNGDKVIIEYYCKENTEI